MKTEYVSAPYFAQQAQLAMAERDRYKRERDALVEMLGYVLDVVSGISNIPHTRVRDANTLLSTIKD